VVRNTGDFPEEYVEVVTGLAGNPPLEWDGLTISSEPDLLQVTLGAVGFPF
jgi:hypothetical protein